MRQTYTQEVRALEENFKKLSRKELDKIIYIADDTIGDRMCLGGIDFFKADIIRIVEAIETNTEL